MHERDDATSGLLLYGSSGRRGHSGRLREAFLALGELPAGRPAVGLDGLKAERETTSPDLAGLRPLHTCVAAMGVDHYEVAAYEVAIGLPESAAGAEEVSRLLRASLADFPFD